MARPELSKEARKAAGKAGTALPNGKYPIRTKRELRAAIKLRHHSTEPYPVVKAHILRRAAALGVKIKSAQLASAVTAACHSEACAPPPAGSGGSCGKGGCQVTVHRKVSRGVMGKGTEKFGTKAGPCGKPTANGSDICARHLANSAKMDAKLMAKRERDAQLLATRKRLTSAAGPAKPVSVTSSIVAACYDKSCAPPPVGHGGSSKGKGGGGVDVKLTSGQMGNLARFAPSSPGRPNPRGWSDATILTSAEAKPLVAKGLLRPSTRSVPGVRNIGNSKRWELTKEGVEVAKRVEYVPREGYKLNARREFPVITKAEARGDSKPVSQEEFQRLANEGQAKLDRMAANSRPIKGLDDNWDQVKADSYAEVVKPWGGATIDAQTGRALPQGANKYALTVKDKDVSTVSIPENASKAEFDAAMERAKEQFRPILEREGHHLGIFHDDDLKRIDIDPVIVVDQLSDVHTIGAATRAIGGAYNFSDGNGYWPPHVEE